MPCWSAPSPVPRERDWHRSQLANTTRQADSLIADTDYDHRPCVGTSPLPRYGYKPCSLALIGRGEAQQDSPSSVTHARKSSVELLTGFDLADPAVAGLWSVVGPLTLCAASTALMTATAVSVVAAGQGWHRQIAYAMRASGTAYSPSSTGTLRWPPDRRDRRRSRPVRPPVARHRSRVPLLTREGSTS